jgi:hypothetical protein
MAAVRKELDEEYEASVGLDAQPQRIAASQKYPATLGLDLRQIYFLGLR